MEFLGSLSRNAEMLGAIEHRRCFRVSSCDSGRSSVVDLRSCPDESVVVDVDTAVASGHAIGSRMREPCDCSHTDQGGTHLRCDYLALAQDGHRTTVVYIEVKTGISDEHGDVEHGLKQVMCSKVVFESEVKHCVEDVESLESFGVVVSPAFEPSQRNQRNITMWSIANRLRLIQVGSGEDLWTKCMAS